MFRLPVSKANGMSFLSDHSATSILTALLSDDLDDRIDIVRDTLLNDALLACWSVQEAHARDCIMLYDPNVAARWLEQHFLDIVFAETDGSLEHIDSLSRITREAWRGINDTSVRAANHAKTLAQQENNLNSQLVQWLAILKCTDRQIATLSQRNGHSPLDGYCWAPPTWLSALHRQTNESGSHWNPDAIRVAEFAVETTSSTNQRWLDHEQDLNRPKYQDSSAKNAKRLVPAMLKKLYRLRQLEMDFATRLHEEKMMAMQQLAYGASHEINNPLANISARAQSLMKTEHDSGRRRKLVAINDQAFRAYEMIADLMLFAKPPQLNVKTFELHSLLDQLRQEIQNSANGSPITCVLHNLQHQAGQPILVTGDPTHLATAIKAICVNGIDAMGGHGELIIEMNPSHRSKVEISIEDSGRGFNELAKQHLFDPFFSGREAGRGMGFGLSKAWRIIKQHDGDLRIRSDTARGSRITITLPIEESAEAAGIDVDI